MTDSQELHVAAAVSCWGKPIPVGKNKWKMQIWMKRRLLTKGRGN